MQTTAYCSLSALWQEAKRLRQLQHAGGSEAGLRDKTHLPANYDCAPQEAQARQQQARARKAPTPPDSHEERAQRAARELQVRAPPGAKALSMSQGRRRSTTACARITSCSHTGLLLPL